MGNTGSLAKTGNDFAGWNTEADGSGTLYSVGATFTITADTPLYAQWTPSANPNAGKIWTAVDDSAFGTTSIYGVAWGNNTWVAFDQSNTMAYSK